MWQVCAGYGASANVCSFASVSRSVECAIAAVFSVFRRMGELSGCTYRTDIHDIVGNDDHTVAEFWVVGSRAGKQIKLLTPDIYHVRDGQITEFWTFFHEDSHTWDEFWS